MQQRQIYLLRHINTFDIDHCALVCPFRQPEEYCKLFGKLKRDDLGLIRDLDCHHAERKAAKP